MDQDLCRVCLNELQGGISISIGFFEGTVWTCIADLAAIPAENDPSLPQEICQTCFGSLGIAIQLRERVIKSYEKLRLSIDPG